MLLVCQTCQERLIQFVSTDVVANDNQSVDSLSIPPGLGGQGLIDFTHTLQHHLHWVIFERQKALGGRGGGAESELFAALSCQYTAHLDPHNVCFLTTNGLLPQ